MKSIIIDDISYILSDKEADKIKFAIQLIDRIFADNYFTNAFINHNRKWGELEIDSVPMEDGKYYEWKMNRKNVRTEKDDEQERKEAWKLHEHASYMERQDIRYLMYYMGKHLQGWWD